ncbi:MAG: Na+/H+ antiporter [Gammaproteobacteria bacterium]
MSEFEIYIILLGIIVGVSLLGRNLPVPSPLLLVITGMLLSFIPTFPVVRLDPKLVFNIFLPLLIYHASTYTSWPDVKLNIRPIALLSVGHVIFITVLVAIVAHTVIPNLSWPLAFVLGAVVAPPDVVAIFSIAEKVKIPQRLMTVLAGESLLNDATALILFRLAVIAVVSHQLSIVGAFSTFLTIVICETLYGLILGHLIGQIRLRINDSMSQMLLSILTPFIAYLPAVKLGGSGVLATVVTGLVIGHFYLDRLMPGARLLWLSVWETIGFIVSSILFLLIGLDLRLILENIASIPTQQLIIYSGSITLTVLIGRFIWVYPATYLSDLFTPSAKRKKSVPWQFPFVISWSGMRGGISLAAALTIPPLSMQINNASLRELIIFIVFCVITATLLVQGLTLPWILKKIGLDKISRREDTKDRLDELQAKCAMTKAVLAWLHAYKNSNQEDIHIFEEIEVQIKEYEALEIRIEGILSEMGRSDADPFHLRSITLVLSEVVEIERDTISRLWHEGKITMRTRGKLLQQLDLHAKRYIS